MDDFIPFYVSPKRLQPSQLRYSRKNVADKIQKAFGRKDVILDPITGLYRFQHDDGNSIYPLQEAIPAIITPEVLVLADGHHSVLASLELGCPTIPIIPVAQWDGPINQEFWLWAEAQSYAYLLTLEGERKLPPPTLSQLQEDPLRYFAALSARKYDITTDPPTSRGAPYPLWIKIGRDIPFIEMQLATHLYQSGFQYAYGDEETRFEHLIEQARLILTEKPLDGLKFLPEREHYLDSKQIQQWLERCTPS
jgi:hypothetical protein